MRKTLGAFSLALLLACSASAGIMQNDVTGTPPPPSQTMTTEQEPAADGEIHAPLAADETESGLTQTILNLLAGVLAAV